MPTRLKRLAPMKGYPKLKKGRPLPLPKEIPGGDYVTEDEPHVSEIWIRLGRKSNDLKTAKRVAHLMEQYPNGTIPELVAMDWLNQNQVQYEYLAQVRGGRSRLGGVEADFLIQAGGVGLVWLINGNYWHSRPEVAESDVVDKLRFLGSTYHGIRIEKVCALWERRVYEDRPQIFELAMVGIELGM
jgi:hypothetical protein